MNLNEKDISQPLIINNNNNIIKEEKEKAKEEELINNNYIKIDPKIQFKKDNSEIKNISEVLLKYFTKSKNNSSNEGDTNSNLKTTTKIKNNMSDNNISLDNINSITLIRNFIEKTVIQKNASGFFDLCKKISFQYFKKHNNKNEAKNKIEDCVNYLLQNKLSFEYFSLFELNKEMLHSLGYILMNSYYNFHDFKINDSQALKNNIKKVSKEQSVLIDFYQFCAEKKITPDEYKKTHFWEKHAQNYYLPGVFIFLLNSLTQIKIMNINLDNNIDEEDNDISNEDIEFLFMIIFNIKYIFKNVSNIKFNLIFTKFQYYIFSKFFVEYKDELSKIDGDVKKNYLKLDYIYEKKWDFQTKFLLNERRKFLNNKHLEKINKNNEKKNNNNIGNNNSIRINEGKQNSFNNPDVIDKNINILNSCSNYLHFILLLIYSMNQFNNLLELNLIINDSYYPELYQFLKRDIVFKEKEKEKENNYSNNMIFKDFNIADIIFDKFSTLTILKLEINSLDYVFFKKILEKIYHNSLLIKLKISLFSSDVTYLQQSLYRLYNPLKNQELSFKFKGHLWRDNSIQKILDKLLDNFCINLQMLFNLIRYHKKLQVIGFNFDIPSIIENNQKYMMIIIKFILNILLYIVQKDNIIQKCTILAPKIKFNNNIFPLINKILRDFDFNESNDININQNNEQKNNINRNDSLILKELSFQVQMYQLINIKYIISESLKILNIGDCDIITFKELVKHLISYKFCIKSNLSKLSISLIKSFRVFNDEIYNLLYQIFNIKIKQLSELNIYSNIIIKTEKEYYYLLKIFHNNWIYLCTLTLNESSKNIYESKQCIIEKKKIKYLVSECLENDLLTPENRILKKKIIEKGKDKDKIIEKNDEAFWFLKYIFKIRYSCDNVGNNTKKNKSEVGDSLSKFLSNNILSYLHFTENIELKHNIEVNNNNVKD